jgi:hypothetical protein
MSPDHAHEIEELSLDKRTLLGEKYRRVLYHASQAAIWISYLYFAVRLFFLLTTPGPTWKMLTMFGIEVLFAREYDLF